MQKLTELVKLSNGNLQVELTEDGREEAQDILAGIGTSSMLARDMSYWLEWHLGEGWELLAPEDLGALTSCDVILSDSVTHDYDGEVLNVMQVWWYPDYAIRNPASVLMREGSVTLTKGGD